MGAGSDATVIPTSACRTVVPTSAARRDLGPESNFICSRDASGRYRSPRHVGWRGRPFATGHWQLVIDWSLVLGHWSFPARHPLPFAAPLEPEDITCAPTP